MRDDSDYMQWFVCDDNESMFKVDKSDMSISKFIPEYMDGWDDEDHLISAIWNLCGLAWTEEKRPDLIDIPSRTE